MTLTCTADGVPTPSVTWFRNGELVIDEIGSKFTISETVLPNGLRPGIPESVSSSLTVSDLVTKDDGEYSCSAKNGVGTPTISQTPYTLTVTAGQLNYDVMMTSTSIV